MDSLILDTVVFPGCALLAIAILGAIYPLRKNKKAADWGALVTPLKSKSNRLYIVVVVLVPLMVCLLFIRDMGTLSNLVLSATGVLAFELVLRDQLIAKKSGVYENALVADGQVVMKADFLALPTLEYEDSEEYKKEKSEEGYELNAIEHAAKVLQIVTREKGTQYVNFETAEDRAKAVEIVRNWV